MLTKPFSFALTLLLLATFNLNIKFSHAAVLVQGGKSAYSIVIPADAIPAEKTAAEQLQKYVLQMTKATLPIKVEKEVSADTPQVLVGNSTRARSLVKNIDWNNMGQDSIVMHTVGQHLILAGDRPRGALYAVFQFLEEAGCRFWWPGAYSIPAKSSLEIVPRQTNYTPPFAYRQQNSSATYSDAEYATMMRLNGNRQPQGEGWGGHYEILGWVHTFSKLLPVEKYFKEHPEWYSDPKNGYKPATKASSMPAPQTTDLCLGNPQVQEAITREALAWIEKNPNAGYISISQNDNIAGYCRDEFSEKLIKEEGSPAAPLLTFVNAVAKKIEEKYPDFLVETLAYLYSEDPPKTIVPARNVLVRLAPINADFSQPLNSEKNSAARDNLLKWEKISNQLFVWNYVTNFNNMLAPHPNLGTLGEDLRFFAAHKVTGIFQQGNSQTNDVGDFVPLRTYLISKLLWDPNLDQNQLQQEFMAGYYGAAAPYLNQYLQLIDNSFPRGQRKLSTFNSDLSFLTLDVMNQATELFDQAGEAVKTDAVLKQRVETERLTLDLMWMLGSRSYKAFAALQGKPYLGAENVGQTLDNWKKAMAERDVRYYGEELPIEGLYPRLEAATVVPVVLPAFAQGQPAGHVIDFQPQEFDLSPAYGKVVPDADASGGKAARISGNTNAWALKMRLKGVIGNEVLGDVKWKVVAIARIEKTPGAPDSGGGIQAGIYDVPNKVSAGALQLPLTRVRDEKYLQIELATTRLSDGMYFWVAPVDNPNVAAIYVDRIIMMRQ